MLEMLLFGLVSALVVILLMPADAQLRVRRHTVRILRLVADGLRTIARDVERQLPAEPGEEGITRKDGPSPFGSVTVMSTQRVFDAEQAVANTNRRLDDFIADYKGDASNLKFELNQLKQRIEGLQNRGGIDIDICDQASELRSMVDIEYVQDSVTGAVDQVPVKRRGRME